MLTTRIQGMLLGYKRKVSNTEQFLLDIAKVDKFILLIKEKKDYFKIRNRFCEVYEVFELDAVDSFIKEYQLELFDRDMVDTYNLVKEEIRTIKGTHGKI